MAMPKNTFWFRPGRLERSGRKNPGIMAVDDKFEFTVAKSNKEGSVWSYRCKFLLTPKIKCKAKAKVVFYDGKWVLQEICNNHECEPNRPRVIAEKLKHEMKELVRSDPVQPVGKAVRKVRVEAAERFGDDEDFFLHLIAELGCDSALEKQLLRVRQEIYGPTPRSRIDFEPEIFLEKIYGDKENVSSIWI